MLCAIALCLISCGSSGKFVSPNPKFHFRHPDLHHHRQRCRAALLCFLHACAELIKADLAGAVGINLLEHVASSYSALRFWAESTQDSFSSLTKTAPLPSLSKTENAFLYEAIISSEIAGGVPPARALSPRARMALPRVRAQSPRAHSPRAQSPRLWASPPRAQAEPSWAPLWLCVPLLWPWLCLP